MKQNTPTPMYKRISYYPLAALLLMVAFIGSYSTASAGAPKGINYQAAVRTSTGATAANQSIGARFTIHSGSPGGAIVFREHHTVPTNAFGIFTVVIGGGNITTGDLDSINWSAGTYFLQVETDPTGANNYIDMGTTQLMSVPYSFYSNKAKRADTSELAIRSLRADTADVAVTALTALTAINAVHAHYADTVIFANKSDKANLATTADSATTAANARHADTTGFATSAAAMQLAQTDTFATFTGNRLVTISPTTSFFEVSSTVIPSSAMMTLSNGTKKGQCITMLGTSSGSNGVRIDNSGNVQVGSSGGPTDLQAGSILTLMWSGTKWVKVAYSSNQ